MPRGKEWLAANNVGDVERETDVGERRSGTPVRSISWIGFAIYLLNIAL